MDQLDYYKTQGAGEQEKHKYHLQCIMERNFDIVKNIKEKDPILEDGDTLILVPAI